MRVYIKYFDYDGMAQSAEIWMGRLIEMQILNTDPVGSELGENNDRE